MAALLCVFIVFAKTLGIIYGCGPPWKRVSPLNIQFCQKKCYLIFDYWLFVKAIFDNFKEVWLELNNELIYEFYYARLFIQTDTQFCSLCWRITKIGMGALWYLYSQEKKGVLTSTLHTGASLLWKFRRTVLATFSHATEAWYINEAKLQRPCNRG